MQADKVLRMHQGKRFKRQACSRRGVVVVLGAACAALSARHAVAQNIPNYYSSGTNNAAIGTIAADWSLGSIPAATNDAVFNSSSPTANLTAANLSTGTYAFGSLDDSNAHAINIINNASSGTTTLTLGGASVNSYAPSSSDLLYVAAGSTFAINSSTGAPLSLVLGQSGNFDIAGNATIGAVITNASGGAYGIVKTGAGNLTLTAANVFTGGINISAGSLTVASSTYLGANTSSAGITTTLNGGTLIFSNTGALAPGYNKFWSLGSAGGTFNVSNAAVTLEGVISGTGSLTKTGPGTLTLEPLNSGAILQSNTFTGGVNVNQGTLQIDTAGAIANASPGVHSLVTMSAGTNFNYVNTLVTTASLATEDFLLLGGNVTFLEPTAGQTTTITGNFSGAGSFIKGGVATYVINGTGTYTGTTNVTAGTLEFGNEVSLYNNNQSGWTASYINVSSGATLAFGVGGATQFTASDIAILSAIGTANSGFQNGSNIGFDTGSASFSYGGVIANTNGGSNVLGVVKLGANTLTLSGTNTYTGPTTILAGTLQFNGDSAIGGSGANVNVNSGAIVAAGAPIDQAFINRIYNGSAGVVALAASSSNNLDFSPSGANLPNTSLGATGAYTYSGTLTPNGATYRLGGGGGTLTVSSPLVSPNTLLVSGAGMVILTGTNTYSGTTVTNGVLEFGTYASYPGTIVSVGAGGTVILGIGGAGQFTTSQAATFLAAPTTVLSAGATFGIDTSLATSDTVYSGSITNSSLGTVNFLKTGANNLVLTGNNTYTGITNISAGTLTIGNGGSTGTLGTGSVLDNSVLAFNYGSGASVTVPNYIYGTGTIVQNGPGTVVLSSAANNESGGSIINAGVLELKLTTNELSLLSAPYPIINAGALRMDVTITSSRGASLGSASSTIDVAAGATLTLNGNVTGTGNLNVNGTSATDTGTLALNGINGYSGITNINAGTLIAESTSALSTSTGTVTLANVSGATLVINNINLTIGSLTGGGSAGGNVNVGTGTLTIGADNSTQPAFAGSLYGTGGIVKEGSGVLSLTGSNTYGGGTNVSGGTLLLAGTASQPALTNMIVGSGADLSLGNVSGGAYAISLNTLSNGGLIDIGKNALVIHGGSNVSSISLAVAQNYYGGAWNGTIGITSSAAAGDSSHLTAVGVISNDNGHGLPLYGASGTIRTSFDGTIPVDGDVLVKYTYYGDTDLSGVIDGSDYSRVDTTYQSENFSSGIATLPISGWFNGDFNYDGVVDGSDYTLMDNAFNTQTAILSAAIASPTALIAPASAVPEPASLGLLAITGAGILGRRRRR